MRKLIYKIKEYLNESTTIFSRKRYKSIIGFLIFQICSSVFIVGYTYIIYRDIIKPITNKKNLVIINYNDIFYAFVAVLGGFFWMWIFSFNLTVSTFCSERWTKYCIENKRPYFNYIFYPFFKNDYYKQVKLDWCFAIIVFILGAILMRLPQKYQVNVDTKIMSYYGYTFCKSIEDKYNETFKLVYALDVSKCP